MLNLFKTISHFNKILILMVVILIKPSSSKDVDLLLVEGDSIHIQFPLDKKIHGHYILGTDGSLHLGVGPAIYLDGLNVAEAKMKIKELVSRYYKNTSQVRLYIIEKRKRICVTGQVKLPGFYSMHKDSDLQMLIQRAGGFTDGAKLDEFIVSNKFDETIRKVPYQSWIESPESGKQIQVYNGDCIFVPRSASMGKIHRHLLGYTPPPDESRRNIINVLGEVIKPGSYEINTTVNVLDMIAMAGGPQIPRNSNIIYDLESIQVIKKNGRVFTFNMNQYFKDGDQDLLIPVEAGDNILIPSKKVNVEDKTKSVAVMGAVKSPSSYEISQTISLQQMLARAGGFISDSNMVLAKTDSILVVRRSENNQVKKIIYNFNKLLNGYYGSNNVLLPDDILFVPWKSEQEIANEKGRQSVTIMGEVPLPGKYSLPDSLGLVNIIGLAGGVKLQSASGIITIIRIQNGTRIKLDFNLEGFIHEPTVASNCRVEFCVQSQPEIFPGDVIIVERKSALFFKEWLDLIWKTATVGIFIYTVMH